MKLNVTKLGLIFFKQNMAISIKFHNNIIVYIKNNKMNKKLALKGKKYR